MVQQNQDQLVFSADQLEKTIQDSIDSILAGKIYNQKLVPKWINQICQDVIKKLTLAQKPYKYMVNCVIMQRNGAGCIVSHSSYWDTAVDLSATIIWPKDKQSKAEQTKATIQCAVSVYALSLIIST